MNIFERPHDLALLCADCGKDFLWPAAEQKTYQGGGIDQPARCEMCRRSKPSRTDEVRRQEGKMKIGRGTHAESGRNMLTAAEYNRLCRQACSFPVSPIAGETLEEAYWWVICRAVHSHLGEDFTYQPVAGLARGDAYRQTLQQLVGQRQAEPFDSLAIARQHIATGLRKEGGTSDHKGSG